MAQAKEGLTWYKIVDPADAAEASKIVDDLDNLIRRAKQHDVK